MRPIRLTVDNLPQYAQGRSNRYFTDLWGLAGTGGPSTLSFYYRQAGGRKLTFTINAQEQAGFKLSNMAVRSAPAALAQEFDNGVVLVNPSRKRIEFNLIELFAYKGKYRRIIAQSPERMIADRRIRERYSQHLKRVAEYNNGQPVKNPRKVAVGPLNALFLVKDHRRK